MLTKPYKWCSAGTALDAIELWARNRTALLLRETGQVVADRRLDGLLIPAGFTSQVPIGFTGVEVKVHRGDFLRGLNDGQFDAYLKKLNALYIATPYGEVKTSEIPPEFGHLVVRRRRGFVCVCRRRAPWHDFIPDQKVLWRAIFDLLDQYGRERDAERRQIFHLRENIGMIAADKIKKLLPNYGD